MIDFNAKIYRAVALPIPIVEVVYFIPHKIVFNAKIYRGVAQLVAYLTGGQVVASSSLVTPTIEYQALTRLTCKSFFYLV